MRYLLYFHCINFYLLGWTVPSLNLVFRLQILKCWDLWIFLGLRVCPQCMSTGTTCFHHVIPKPHDASTCERMSSPGFMRHPCPQHRPGHSSQRGHGAALHTGFTDVGGWLWSAPWGNGLWASALMVCCACSCQQRADLSRGLEQPGPEAPVGGPCSSPAGPSTRSSCSHEPKGPEVGLGCLPASRSFLRWAIIWNYELFSFRSRRKWSMEVRGLLSGAHLPCAASVHCGKKLVHQVCAFCNWDFLWVFWCLFSPNGSWSLADKVHVWFVREKLYVTCSIAVPVFPPEVQKALWTPDMLLAYWPLCPQLLEQCLTQSKCPVINCGKLSHRQKHHNTRHPIRNK